MVIPNSLRMTLFWGQFFSLYPSLSNVWPTFLLRFLSFTSILNLDLGYFGVGCDLVTDSYFTLLVLKILMPVIFSLFLLVRKWIYSMLKPELTFSVMHIFSGTLFITNFFSIQLISSMLQVFNCVDNGSGTFVVKQAPSISCSDSAWKRFVSFDVAAMIGYFIVLPGMVIFIFKKSDQVRREKFLSSVIQPLYRPGGEWYELFRFAFRIVFVIVRDAIHISNASKASLLVLLMLVCIWVETNSRPFQNSQLQALSIM
jgi:hypothetical protein